MDARVAVDLGWTDRGLAATAGPNRVHHIQRKIQQCGGAVGRLDE